MHSDPVAEQVRAAICDDEVLQAIGRGRGVNRIAETQLEVHVLADVALPLVHDRVLVWDMEKPDIVQCMLLDGLAVTSPGDAFALHPHLFGSEKQAQKALERALFKRQIPLRDTYREMSLKSARYKRPERGRSWECVYWLGGSAGDVRQRLEAELSVFLDWRPKGDTIANCLLPDD